MSFDECALQRRSICVVPSITNYASEHVSLAIIESGWDAGKKKEMHHANHTSFRQYRSRFHVGDDTCYCRRQVGLYFGCESASHGDRADSFARFPAAAGSAWSSS